jgi:hypothetical protein
MAFDFDAFEARLGQRFDAIETRLDGLDARVDRLDVKVGILHEDVKADLRFSLEALQGVQEQLETKIETESATTRKRIDGIVAALRAR